jgi:hypothetical protein
MYIRGFLTSRCDRGNSVDVCKRSRHRPRQTGLGCFHDDVVQTGEQLGNTRQLAGFGYCHAFESDQVYLTNHFGHVDLPRRGNVRNAGMCRISKSFPDHQDRKRTRHHGAASSSTTAVVDGSLRGGGCIFSGDQ